MPPPPSAAYERLRAFIAKRMRMSPINQPLMLMELLGHGVAWQEAARPRRRTWPGGSWEAHGGQGAHRQRHQSQRVPRWSQGSKGPGDEAMSRYSVGGSAAECEPGSDGLVLRNLLGIKDPAVMEAVERDLLLDLYQAIVGNGTPINRLRMEDLIGWHRQWLGSVYAWAGKVRPFNLSKQGFAFASANLLPDLLKAFESEQLARLTPFNPESMDELISGFAQVHVEFVLIHPFREGNGRIARLLIDVMACQAGIGPLDYSAWDQQREQYFAAIRAGAVLDMAPMEAQFRQVLPGSTADP